MLLGYNTNGLAHHDPADAVRLLAELGYQSVALTIDHSTLNPYRADFSQQIAQMRGLLEKYQLRAVIETGARFLLDPRTKHEPTLVTAELSSQRRRVEFLMHAIDAAAQLGGDCVSFWSGIVRDEAGEEQVWKRLVAGLRPVMDHARRRGVALGFEPEPGMFIDTMRRYDELLERLDAPDFRLTLDLGHLHCQGETPIADQIARYAERLVNVHLEDMRRGVHEHLMFGEGEMDFPPIFAALRQIGYQGGLHVELSRHDGVRAAEQAQRFLQPLLET